jgi:hypothetical protein
MIGVWVIIVILLLIGGGVWAWPLLAGLLGISSVSDKPGALKHIAQLMHTYDVTPAEVETAFNTNTTRSAPNRLSKGDIARTLFSYLGAIFVLAGISTYIGMFWDSMGSAMRILVTLGVGYVLFIVLVSALHEKKFPRLILPLTLACVLMMTGGWFVLIHELFPGSDDLRPAVLLVFGVMALQLGVLFSKYRLTVLAFMSLFFVYGFLHAGLDMLGIPLTYIAIILGASLFLVGTALEKTSHRALVEPFLLIGTCWLNGGLFDLVADLTAPNQASLIVGVCVMLTAYGLQRAARYPRLSGLGYFFGSIMVYSGLFDLVQHTSVELVYLAVTAAILYGCVVLQSRALLLTTVIAMLGFIGYYSAEHFANSLGWPVTLILMGVAFFGVGTLALKAKRRI